MDVNNKAANESSRPCLFLRGLFSESYLIVVKNLELMLLGVSSDIV